MPIRTRSFLISSLIMTLAVHVAFNPALDTPDAYAQEEEEASPFKIGVLNVSKDTSRSKKPTAQIVDLLDRADGTESDTESFKEAIESAGLSVSKLRTGDGRDANKEAIGEAVKSAGLDAIILIDVYKKGRTMQLLMLGQDGEEIHESKSALKKRGALSEEQGQEILRDAFADGLPVIQAQRDAAAEQRRLEEEAAAAAAAEEEGGEDGFDELDDDGFGDEADGFDDEEMSGPLPGEVTLSVGAFFGLRSIVFQRGALEIENRNPLVGAAARTRLFKGLADGKMHIGLDADISWAPFGSRATQGGQDVTLQGTFVRGGGVAKFAYAVVDLLALGLHGGADVYSLTIEPNDTYTGHRYIWARVGADILLMPTDDFMLGIHGSALPILQTATSGGAYGEADSGFGFEAGATLKLALSESLGVLGTYRFTNVNIGSYSGSPFFAEGTTITSQDAMHSGMLNLAILF